jgi:Mn-dependent DtxR family transcriptional regulator
MEIVAMNQTAPDEAAVPLTFAERSCIGLTPGEGRYLLALHDLNRGDAKISQAALARKLGVSHPTALEMVRRLRELQLVQTERLALTSTGVSAVLVLTSRRQAATMLAHEVLGFDEAQAEVEGERLAAQASSQLGRHLVAWRAHHPK